MRARTSFAVIGLIVIYVVAAWTTLVIGIATRNTDQETTAAVQVTPAPSVAKPPRD